MFDFGDLFTFQSIQLLHFLHFVSIAFDIQFVCIIFEGANLLQSIIVIVFAFSYFYWILKLKYFTPICNRGVNGVGGQRRQLLPPPTVCSNGFLRGHLKPTLKGCIWPFLGYLCSYKCLCQRYWLMGIYGTSKLPKIYRNDFKHDLYCCTWWWFQMSA